MLDFRKRDFKPISTSSNFQINNPSDNALKTRTVLSTDSAMKFYS
jgi:hypothetical protein